MSTTGRLASAVAACTLAAMVGSSAFGQESGDQQKCINTLNKDTAKVAATVGKNNSTCIKDATKGTPSVTCVSSGGAKVAGVVSKAGSDETKNACTTMPNAPDFGYSSAAGGSAAAQTAEVDLFSDTYGQTDTTGVISTVKADAKCQSAVTKDLEKTIATKWKQYLACKKDTLKAGANSAAALVSCVSGPDPNSIATDGKGKIAKTVTKLGDDIGKDCVAPVVIGTDFPGQCSGATTATLAACLDARAECRICEAINGIDNLAINCDVFDDGIANGSCTGRYVQTTTGGTLQVSVFAAFPFPAGGVTLQDISLADGNGVSQTVVPYPGGLTTPVFCVPALNATTSVTQAACGIGKIDWNGGSDFTVNELGDTSEIPACNVHQATCPGSGPAPDSSGRLDVTVGDGVVDTCASGGTANAITIIPVNTLTWVGISTSDTCDMGSGFCVIESAIACSSDADCNSNVICPDTAANGGNGMYDMGTETKLAQFPQTLDLTTDTATAKFMDLGDLDGCKKSGLGPNGPYTYTGQCINLATETVDVAGAGTIFSSGGPTYDLLFATVQDAVITGPGLPGGATCAVPPQINFSGSTTRCIVGP